MIDNTFKAKSPEPTNSVTVDLTVLFTQQADHEARLDALESWKDEVIAILTHLKDTSHISEDKIDALSHILEQNNANLTEVEDTIHKLIVELRDSLDAQVKQFTARLEQQETELQAHRELTAYIKEQKENDEKHRKEKEIADRKIAEALKEKERIDEQRHKENTRRYRAWAPVVLVVVGAGSVKSLSIVPNQYTSWVTGGLMLGALLYYIFYTKMTELPQRFSQPVAEDIQDDNS